MKRNKMKLAVCVGLLCFMTACGSKTEEPAETVYTVQGIEIPKEAEQDQVSASETETGEKEQQSVESTQPAAPETTVSVPETEQNTPPESVSEPQPEPEPEPVTMTPLTRAPRITLDPIPKPIGGAPMPNLAPTPEPEAPAAAVADDLDAMMAAAAPEPQAEALAEAMPDVAPEMAEMEMPAEDPLPEAMPEMEMPDEALAADIAEPMPDDSAMPDMAAMTEALPDAVDSMPEMADMADMTTLAEGVELPTDVPADPMSDTDIMPEVEMPAAEMPEMDMSGEAAMPTAQDAAPQAPTMPQQAGASLEELLDESSPLHDRFAALIAAAVTTALHNNAEALAAQASAAPQMPLPDMDALNARLDAIEARLDQLATAGEANAAALANVPAQLQEVANVPTQLQEMELASKSAAARMDAIEQRLDALEPRFNAEVEKAAANAAARILREEIAKLLQA